MFLPTFSLKKAVKNPHQPELQCFMPLKTNCPKREWWGKTLYHHPYNVSKHSQPKVSYYIIYVIIISSVTEAVH